MAGSEPHHETGSIARGPLAERVNGLFEAAVSPEAALRTAQQTAVGEFCDWCVVDFYTLDGELTAVHSGYPDPRRLALILDIRRRYRSERGENGDVLAALAGGEPLLYRDMSRIASVRLSDEEAELLEAIGLKSSIVVPMHADDEPLGVVSFVSTSRHYNDSDLVTAREFAAGCLRVISRWREVEEIKRTLALWQTVYAGAPVGLALVGREGRFERVNDRLASLSGASIAELIGHTPAQAMGDVGAQLGALCRTVRDGHGPIVEVELTGAAARSPRSVRRWLVSCQPVVLERRVVGVSCVVQDITSRKRAEQRAAFLAHAGEILDFSLDYRQTLEQVARLAVPQIADWCSISMMDERGRIYRLAVAHADPVKDRLGQELIEREALPSAAPAGAATAMLTARTQLIEEFTDDLLIQSLADPHSHDIIRTLGLGSSVSVPLVARGRMLGAITLVSETAFHFEPTDVQLAEELARRAAMSIDNARLYTEHSRIAHTLQASLLPQELPEIPGLSLAARFRPAGELNEVGGDFYDVYLRPTGEWLVVIGDVTGHGAKAAATTALIRYTLRAAALRPGSAQTLLRELNRAMLAQAASHCTLVLLSIPAAASRPLTFTICLAGHPPPYLLAAGRDPVEVGIPGTMLGYVEDPALTDTPVTLRAGEVLLLYTDGLTDGSPHHATRPPLPDWLRAADAGDLPALLSELERRVVDDAGGRPRDDIAMLALRCR
jgi:PAS domain S-box-containing protein